jgi:hypothetical protein
MAAAIGLGIAVPGMAFCMTKVGAPIWIDTRANGVTSAAHVPSLVGGNAGLSLLNGRRVLRGGLLIRGVTMTKSKIKYYLRWLEEIRDHIPSSDYDGKRRLQEGIDYLRARL